MIDDNRPSILPLAIAAGLLFLLFAWVVASEASPPPRYLKLGYLYEFEYLDSLPCTPIRPMLWDSANGFSELSETPQYLYTIVDSNLRLGYVLQDMTSNTYFVFWMLPEWGDDNQPHVQAAEWIHCETETG